MVRLNSIQVLRAVAALVVVVFHFNAVERYLGGKVEVPFFSLFYFFGYGGVNLFFVISGFIITWVHYRELGDSGRGLSYLRKRLVRLFPVYLAVWLAAALISYSLLRDDYCVEPGVFWHLAQTASLALGVENCFVPQAWSLSWELLFYCVFFGFFFVRKEAFIPALLLWAVSILLAHGAGLYVKGYAILSPLNLQFIGGCMVGILALRGETRFARLALAAGLAWVTISIVLNAAGQMSVDLDWHRVAQYGAGSTLIVYGLVAMELRAGEMRYPKWLIELGNASYSIYLTHLTYFLVVRRLFDGLTHSPGNHAIYAVALIIGATLTGWLVYRLVERPMLAAFRGVHGNWQSIGYVGAGLAASIIAASLITRSYDQIVPPAEALELPAGTVEGEGSDTKLLIDGAMLKVLPERQGWVSSFQVAGSSLSISGWALDRERSRTALAVAVFVDGNLVEGQAPVYQFRAVEGGVKFVDGHRPGFKFEIQNALGRDVRLFAILPDGRAGELYYPDDFRQR